MSPLPIGSLVRGVPSGSPEIPCLILYYRVLRSLGSPFPQNNNNNKKKNGELSKWPGIWKLEEALLSGLHLLGYRQRHWFWAVEKMGWGHATLSRLRNSALKKKGWTWWLSLLTDQKSRLRLLDTWGRLLCSRILLSVQIFPCLVFPDNYFCNRRSHILLFWFSLNFKSIRFHYLLF